MVCEGCRKLRGVFVGNVGVCWVDGVIGFVG